MASPVVSQDVVHVDNQSRNNPPPAPGVIRQPSHSSSDQSRSTPQSDPKVQVQPAVAPAAGTETIETRSGASSMPTPPGDVSSSQLMESQTQSQTPEGRCRPCLWFVFALGFLLVLVSAFHRPVLLDLEVLGLSFIMSAVFKCNVERGIWARQPDIPIEEGKRNPYRDNPSPNGGDIMEPPCTQPQQPPTEQVFQAEVHNPDVPISPSIPSTTAAATGVNPQGGSGHQSSTPSTSDGVVASGDVHATSQKTASKDERVKDS